MNPWRERLSRWFAPIARHCPFSPNTITVLALLLNLGAATCFYFGLFLTAIPLIVVGGLADALDGIVARVQKKESRFGDFLDHVCDRISDTALAAGWMLGSGVREGFIVPGVILVMLNGYIGTQIEATWHERSYEDVGRGEFVLALIVFPIASHLVQGLHVPPVGGLPIVEWLTLLLMAFGILGIVQRMRRAARMGR
jgi:phosphatidylglycerophosphate synthase